MRFCEIGTMARMIAVIAGLAIGLSARPPSAHAADVTVDVELVLAVDVSFSMDEEEQRLQRQGYAEAITAPEIIAAILQGPNRRIAVAYIEWAGAFDQRLLVDWRLIDGLDTARAFADELLARPYRRVQRTSISGGILFAAPMFDANTYDGVRQVIDVSGDGANNQGIPVTIARDDVLAKGIVINGLPIVLKRPTAGFRDIENLDEYYEECVIGGEGSFSVPIRSREDFRSATRMKLLMEIASIAPKPLVVPAAGKAPVDCLIGEKLWQQRQDWMRN